MMRGLLIVAIAHGALLFAAGRDGAPVFFIERPASSPDEARFVVRSAGLTAWFSSGEAVVRTNRTAVAMRFEGANPQARIEGLERLETDVNILVGDRANWQTGLAAYARIVYRELYPGIDMVYASDGRNLKSEFIVAPGADPGRIRVRYTGAGPARISEGGELVVPAEGHELRERAPTIFQHRSGRRVETAGRFAMGADGAMGFSVSGYDRSLPLVIDPVVYSTFLGGSNSDAAMSIAVDPAGAAYVAGYTASTNFPTANPRQNFNAGGNEVFVAKLNAAGDGLVYCTYLGGSGDDRAFGIAVGADGAAVVAGSTTSKNFPLQNALQTKIEGAKDGFVLKLNAAGNTLVFSTYLGGNGSDTATGVALDAAGNIYAAGNTTSTNLPAAGLQNTNGGSQDGFIAKVSAAGALVYSTYLGGSYKEQIGGIAVDSGGTVYITGSTESANFPVVSAAQALPGGGQDAFVARLSAAGDALLFSTYLGGSGGALGAPEAGQGIALDGQGDAYVTGVTSSANFPLQGAFQTSRRGSQDAFVAKVSAAGALVYSSYLGGTGIDAGNAIAVDPGGTAYVAGQTYSADLPVTGAFQSTAGGDYDAFAGKVAPGGGLLENLSYLGGRGSDTATGLALDAAGAVYLAGWTLSADFPLENAYQSLNTGSYGAFIAKLSLGAPPRPEPVSVTPDAGTGAGQAFVFQYYDGNGYGAISSVSTLWNTSATGATGCYILLYPGARALYLFNDAGTGWLSPIVLGGSGSTQNSRCSVSAAGSSVSGSGNTLTVTLAMNFQPAFSGAKNIYMQAYDGIDSGWQQRGTWTIPANAPPSTVSVMPNSGEGATQNFTFEFFDSKGYGAVSSVSMIWNTTATGPAGCYVLLYPAAKALYLANDAATSWLSPIVLGAAGSAQNSQCKVNAAASSVSGSGNTLTVNLSMTFQPAFNGTKAIYMEAYDGMDSGWSQKGTWTVSATLALGPVSVTPDSGVGASQSFSFVFTDAQGYAAIQSASILINGTLTGTGGCYLLYYRASKALYLANDASTAWLGPVTLGAAGTVQNSQCSVSAASSAGAGSGNDLTVTLALTFLGSFSGAKNVYMKVYDGADSGWWQKGTWTVE